MNKQITEFRPPHHNIPCRAYARLFFGAWMFVLFISCQKPPASLGSASDFTYLDTKFKLEYKNTAQQFSAKVKLRMKRDSLIWASITGPVGIEGIRTQITKDSIYLIDRINKQYLESDLDTLTRLLKFEIDYKLMQAILLGDMPLPRYDAEQVSTEGKFLKITQEKEGIEIVNFVNSKIGKLDKLQLLDLASGNRLEIQFLNYRKKQGNWFPQKGLIEVSYKDKNTQEIQKTNVIILHSKTTLGQKPISFPFSVPSKYRN